MKLIEWVFFVIKEVVVFFVNKLICPAREESIFSIPDVVTTSKKFFTVCHSK
jgi:hypothetical protein